MTSDQLKSMTLRSAVCTGMAAVCVSLLCAAPVAAGPGDSIVTVQFVDTVASPYSEFVTMAVYITSTDIPLAAINLRLSVNRPDLVEIPDSAVLFPSLNFTGSAISGWDFKDETKLSDIVLNIAGINNLPGGPTPPPLAPSLVPYRVCSFTMRRIAPTSVMDTLQDRSVTVFAQTVFSSFSDPIGNLIGLRDTVYCANPPACTDSTDDTYDANEYVSGTLTFAPGCAARGDVNSTGTINSADIIFLVNHVFKGGPQPACAGVSGDVNCTGTLNSADIIYLVNYVFKGGVPPCG